MKKTTTPAATENLVATLEASIEANNAPLSLNDFVFNLAPSHSNAEIFVLLEMEGYKYSEKSVRWYASKARAGVRR